MKAVKVTYTVQPDYVEQNKANIRKVMAALRANPIPGMQYSSFTLDDGQTFVHFNVAKDQETLSSIQSIEEFGEFRTSLKASNPVTPPSSENLNLVDMGFEI